MLQRDRDGHTETQHNLYSCSSQLKIASNMHVHTKDTAALTNCQFMISNHQICSLSNNTPENSTFRVMLQRYQFMPQNVFKTLPFLVAMINNSEK